MKHSTTETSCSSLLQTFPIASQSSKFLISPKQFESHSLLEPLKLIFKLNVKLRISILFIRNIMKAKLGSWVLCYQFTLAKNAASLQPYYLSVPKGIGGIQLRACIVLTSISKDHFKSYIPPQLDVSQYSVMKNRLMEIKLVVCVEYRTLGISFKCMVLWIEADYSVYSTLLCLGEYRILCASPSKTNFLFYKVSILNMTC